ncbi:DUF6731 family protein [Arcanobacterium bovis]|uniref:Uncharacterized protein n=1 Tax=Arcanobacterium bovis TaxID=2529275 RepID=A0A4Q9UYN0_9ACTO|nr:DUF6731 family protein [Arcanobacterium bovis]TBW20778.1 hypothetical protein EZJ44_08315 [Arcanobacterium bovis]
MQKKTITRTIKYWALVDAETREPFPCGKEEHAPQWNDYFQHYCGEIVSKIIDHREITGKVVDITEIINTINIDAAIPSFADLIKYGIVISADKDYIPNQHDGIHGDIQPVKLNDGWNAIDNTFVWHLPIGNFIAILGENQSSVRATKYAAWLTHYLRQLPAEMNIDKNKQLAVVPVYEKEINRRIREAHSAKKIEVTFPVGANTAKSTNIFDSAGFIFSGKKEDEPYQYLEAKISISVKRGRSSSKDEQKVLELVQATVHDLENIDSAKAKIIDSNGVTRDLDLFNEHLTTKTSILLGDEQTSPISITGDAVFPQLIRAFSKDFDSLRGVLDSQ